MAAASASVSATISLGFRRLQSPREFPAKIRLSYRPGYGVGGLQLQVKNRLGKVSASGVNPSPNPDAVKGTVGDSSSAADGPPLATILADWPEFAKRVSGEWDGFGADFTPAGSPIELPENVVPEAYREWEVQVFDWQTQCPTLASKTGDLVLTYKLIKLLPTVGCEADAATRHSVEERTAGGEGNAALGLGYSVSGCYVGVWGLESFSGKKRLEVEHCLVDPGNGEVRVRVVMVVVVEEEGRLEMARVRVFSEQWYGPWRNGEQLGGCAVRESGFALSKRVEVGNVVGVWEGRSFGVARFRRKAKDVLQELVEERPQNSIRDQGLIALPKNLWCSFNEQEDGETCAEVGWLLDRGNAITSRCVLLKDGTVKEMAIGQETAVLEEK